MNSLNPKTAKEFAIPFILRISNLDERKFILYHSEAIVETAKLLAKNTSADVELLEIAGWVHDIGKSVADESHAEESLKILEKEFEINSILKDCILNHGASKKPITLEGKIIQAADKISIVDKDILSIFLKNINPKITVENTEMLRKITVQAMDFLEKHNKNF